MPVEESEAVGQLQHSNRLSKLQAPACRAMAKSIEKAEAAIDALIASGIKVKEVIQRVSSIKGIGKQTAVNLYVYTKGFTQFESAGQLACYCSGQ